MIVLDLPHPPRGGVDLRALQIVAALGSNGSVGVFGLVRRDSRPPPFEGVDLWTTTSDSFLVDSPPGGADLEWMRVDGALPTDRYLSETAVHEIAALLEAHRPRIVVIDQLWLHGYIEVALDHGARVVLNHHNAETALQRQLARGASGGEGLIRRSLARRVEGVERRALSEVDQVWVCSPLDRAAIVDEFDPSAEVVVVPNGVDVHAYAEALDHSAAKSVGMEYSSKRLLYPANFAYEPNLKAARLLIEDLFPLLEAGSRDAELLLAGRSPTPALRSAARANPRIIVTGDVPSMVPYLAAAGVVAVPLREGSGTRIKILESFASGVPVVSTAIGAAGLPVTDGDNIRIAESTVGLASAILGLWDHPAQARSQAAAALELVRSDLSWESTAHLVHQAVG